MDQKKTAIEQHNPFFKLVLFFRFPGRYFETLTDLKRADWLLPMLTRSGTSILAVIVSGFLRNKAAMAGEMTLPADWTWWTSDMQNNYLQAVQATQGPVFLYVIPAILGLAGIWLGWGILSGLLHLASTLLGGRGTMNTAVNITAWASLPFALRDILRVIYMLIAGRAISNPGLSGFISGDGSGVLFFASLFKHVDLFLAWQVFLLILGFRRVDALPRVKATAGIIVVILLTLLAQAGIGALTSSLGGMMVTRPFI
jgi:hypothetical protein